MLQDDDQETLDQAVGLGAGVPLTTTREPLDLAVLAVPPAAAGVLRDAQQDWLAQHCTEVASVKALVVAAEAALGCDLTTFVPGHPIGGGERSGPTAARLNPFRGRPWVYCPDDSAGARAVDAVRTVAELTGAVPRHLDLEPYHRAVGLISHLPHLVSSAFAARMVGADPTAMRLTGAGVRDVTPRVAAGDPALWLDVLAQNDDPVVEALDLLVDDLRCGAAELRARPAAPAGLLSLLGHGNDGRRQLLSYATDHPKEQ